MALSGGRLSRKKMLAPQANMTMVRPKGITRPDDFERHAAV